MWNGAISTEDSDDTKIMERQETETESEEHYTVQKYQDVRRKQADSYHELEHKCCSKCNQPCYEIESPELGRRRTRRTKDQLQHCPSCHCPPEAIKYSMGRTNYPKNMDAVLNEYEDFLIDPTSRPFKKSQSYQLSPRMCRVSQCGHPAYGHHHLRKRQSSSHRRQCRAEQDPSLSIIKSILHSSANDTSYEYPRTVRSSYKRDGWRNDQIISGIPGAADMDRDGDKYTQHKREQITKPRQHDSMNKLNGNDRYEVGDYEDDDCLYSRGRLRFEFEEDKKKQARKKVESSPNRHSILKTCGTQPSSAKIKNEDSHKPSAIDQCEYSKDEENLLKESENRLVKPSQRSSRQTENSPCRPDKEPAGNREEIREDSYSDQAVKDEEQETSQKKNIYAGGDLDVDLHTTKNYILGIIDKVLNKKLSPSSDQQKNADSNRGLTTEQGIYIEIRRALQSDLCEQNAEDLLSQSKLNVDYIKHLKDLRWERMNHIQNELRELVKIQKFLDTYSPRQSMAAFQSGGVEQRIEDRQQQQQQYEEKQNLGTIS